VILQAGDLVERLADAAPAPPIAAETEGEGVSEGRSFSRKKTEGDRFFHGQ
jgi:hypothetical protein